MSEMRADYKRLELDRFILKAKSCTCKPEGVCILTKGICSQHMCPFVLWERNG